MRIPPYYKRPGWQRFFAGIIIGTIIGWSFFIYQFGTIHERLIYEIKKQQSTIESQQKDIEILRSDQKKLNEENEKRLTIQEIEVYFTNSKKLKLNELTSYELNQQVTSELDFLKNKDIATVANTRELMFRTIENKTFIVEDTKYKLIVKQVYLYTTMEIHLEIQFTN